MNFLNILFIAGIAVFLIIFYAIERLVVKKGKRFFGFIASLWRSIKTAILENKDVKNWAEKHPQFFSFLKKRFNKNDFGGLPLTLLGAAFLYALSLFLGVTEDIVNSPLIAATDIRIDNLLAAFHSPALIKIFLWITLLGKWQVVFVFAAASITLFWIWGKKLYIAPFLISIAGSQIFVSLAKLIFHRPRPEVAVYIEHSFSFPSGHAAISVAFYGFLAYALTRKVKKRKHKISILFAALLIISAIGFSRLYLGVHYPSDVWGGYLLGLIWLIFAISLCERILAKKTGAPAARKLFTLKTKKIISLVLIFGAILFYVGFAEQYHPALKLGPFPKRDISARGAPDIFLKGRLPKYTETILGAHQEPLSFIIMAQNDAILIGAFRRAGWHLADEVSFSSLLKIAKAAFWKKEYLRAPMTPDFWNNQVHNFGFEKPTDANNVRQRHHARFWRTPYRLKDGEKIYAGTASLDSGIKWGVTHKISPAIDTEREFLFNDLFSTGLIEKFRETQFVRPAIGQNFSGDQFFTDGKIYIIMLK